MRICRFSVRREPTYLDKGSKKPRKNVYLKVYFFFGGGGLPGKTGFEKAKFRAGERDNLLFLLYL